MNLYIGASPLPEELIGARSSNKVALGKRPLEVCAIAKTRVEEITRACGFGEAQSNTSLNIGCIDQVE